jgi:hypothetical protein
MGASMNPVRAVVPNTRMAGPAQAPQMNQPTQQNVFQQSAGAQGQAQQTLGGLSNMQFQPMQAAQAGPTAIYGGANIAPTANFGGATVGQTANFGGATIDPVTQMQAARLGPVERMQGVGQVGNISGPGLIDVNQLATTDFSAYMNPYTQQVVEMGQQDIERQRQMAASQMGARAQSAGAFGGSRQAVQEAVLAGEALREAGQLSSQQRQRGFETALQAGQFDIGQMQSARTLASQQDFQASGLNQQAAEAAANREQAARAGNMQAANQFAAQQAQFEQQARAANAAAANARSQSQAGLFQQAGLAGSAQDAARASQQAGLLQQAGLAGSAQDAARAQAQAGLTQQGGLASMAAFNDAQQAQAAREQAARQTTFGGQFTGAGIRAGAAGQLAGLGQQLFGQGQDITQQQQQFGTTQQAMNQALIEAARAQYAGFAGAPERSIGLPLAAVGAANMGQKTQTDTRQPGLFDYLSLGAGTYAASRPRV